jgi:GT2 family glycosyltransferase
MKDEYVDIIVVNWNGKRFLPECLESVFRQTYPHIRVILVDNNSSDDSIRYVSEHYPEVKVVLLEDNYGFSGANNRGVPACTGRYIALLNNDTKVHPDWIRESVSCLDRHPDAGFCAPKILRYDQRDVIDSAGDDYGREGAGRNRGSGQKADDFNEPAYVFGACAAAAVYRKAMIDEIGLFDDTFFIMCEDVDLSFRAQLAGYRCMYWPRAIVYHKAHGTITGASPVFYYYGQRNLEYVYLKNMPLALLLATLPAHGLYNFLKFTYSVRTGNAGLFLKAKLSVVRNLPAVMRKRWQVQKRRKATVRYLNMLIGRYWIIERVGMVLSGKQRY